MLEYNANYHTERCITHEELPDLNNLPFHLEERGTYLIRAGVFQRTSSIDDTSLPVIEIHNTNYYFAL